ncbi:MAG: hypothetical protein BroJett040_05320 [Oligoflexia bacterium]|nr:MAG: hypothetical protein BroJett040_05320 [Oligoflexia bacterium]
MKKQITLIIVSVFFLISCQTQNQKSAGTDSQAATLQSSMQNLKEVLSKLLPQVIDPAQFNSPDKRSLVDQEVKELSALSKQVSHNPSVQFRDPSLRFISSAFSEDLKRVDESLQLGKREYARYTLMHVTAYCIECHTRTSSGPSFSTPQLEKTLANMKKIDRGEYLLAIRQFDQAFKEFESVISESLASQSNLYELDRAVRNALAISIKFQKDPKKSFKITSLIEGAPQAPYYLKQSAKSWSSAIREWQKEKLISARTASDLLSRCQTLVRQGHRAQMGMSDRGGDVYFLRALSDLHQLLTMDLNKEQLGEALYLTGVSYEAVRDLALWSLHENYYESCIRQVPHSNWSQQCYKKLEESVYFGFTGSSGMRLPLDVQVKLNELQKLALPELQPAK